MVEKNYFGGYTIKNGSGYEIEVCYKEYISPDDTLWHIHNPFIRHLPTLAVQLAITIFIMRFFAIVLRPLRQPRFAAELITAILMGPSAIGGSRILQLFPFENNMLLELFANLGVTYYMFLVGLEMDLSTLMHTGKKPWSIALTGFFIPFFIGGGLYFLPIVEDLDREGTPMGAVFWALTLTITSFPDLARILSEVKLLHTELGKIGLTSAFITDLSTWVFLATAITISDENRQSIKFALVPLICFAMTFWFALRPGIAWIIRLTKNKHGKFRDTNIYFIVIGVIVCGFITDACGTHSMFGAFMFGLVIPKGEFAVQIMERTEEFVTGILLPIFIISSGLKTNFRFLVRDTIRWPVVALITTMATSAKIISTVLVCSIFGMSAKESLTLGGLMNTKGVLALIVLNEGRSLKNLDGISMTVMVFIILFITCVGGPIVNVVSRTRKRLRQKLRTIQGSSPNSELRILTCIHSVQNLSGIIHLLEVSNATRKSPICIFAVHLVELTESASAMLIVHDKLKTSTTTSPSREMTQSDHIFSAFENYKVGNEAASVHPLSVLSPYTTMHEDIFKLAEDKAVSLILIPFHKQPTADGGLRGDNNSIKELNKNLLVKAPCTVGILVNRGLGSFKRSKSYLFNDMSPRLRLAMLFIGGPDDQEALSYAWRMAGQNLVTLTVVRFRLGKDVEVGIVLENQNNENKIRVETKKELDDEYINEFRFKTMCDESITYHEKLVNGSEELEKAIRDLYNNFDLYIVGRAVGVKSPLTKGLIDSGESPELGPIGDLLVSSKFTAHASVLVVQQSASGRLDTRLRRSKSKFKQKKWASPILNPDYEAFVNDKMKDY